MINNDDKEKMMEKEGGKEIAKSDDDSNDRVLENSKGPSLALPIDEVDDSSYTDILDEDGVIVAKSARVVKRDSKINTEFNASGGADFSEDGDLEEGIKKNSFSDLDNLQDLKKKFGFSWKKIWQKSIVFLLVIGIIGILGVSVVAAYVIDYRNNAPSVDELILDPNESSVVYFSDGKTEFFRFYGEENRRYVKLDGISDSMKYAMVALEDREFYKNKGIPWKNIAGAVFDCVVTFGDKCRGASGLSQQLVKNVTKDDSATLDRKLTELFAAEKLNMEKNHDEILELYLNWVPFGKNIYGVQVASNKYFGKDIKDVTIPEACYIASMTQSPIAYYDAVYGIKDETITFTDEDVASYKKILEDRKNTCLDNLRKYDLKGEGSFIESDEELEALKKEEVAFKPIKDERKYPHWQDYIRQELTKIIPEEDLNTKGYKIVATLDPEIQDNVESIFKEHDWRLDKYGANNTAGVVIEGNTGNIVAMVGSRDYNNEAIDGQVNITTSGQAPGSSFKPYVYATTFGKGFNPSTVLVDKKTEFERGYSPNNVDMSQRGLMTMRYGLQNSLNVPAVKAAYAAAGAGNADGYAGIMEVKKTALAMGLKFPNGDCIQGVAAALGTCDVTLVSHAGGFNTFAQSGKLMTPKPFKSIEVKKTDKDTQEDVDRKNKEIADKLKEVYPINETAIEPAIANQIANVLNDNTNRGFSTDTANGLVIPNWVGKIAAKTGTATNDKNMPTDVWVNGFTRYYTVTLWAGNTDNKQLNAGAFGTNTVTPVWNDIMVYLHRNIDPATGTFKTDGLKKTNVYCPKGTLGGANCSGEWLTEKQIQKLSEFGNKLSSADYDPYKGTVFDYGGEAVERKVKVSVVDGLLVKNDQVPVQLTKDISCIDFVSMFPTKENWLGPVVSYADSYKKSALEKGYYEASYFGCPKTYSTITASDTTPITTITGIANGTDVSNTVDISVTPVIPSTTISTIEVRVNGASVVTYSGASAVFDAQNSGVYGPGKTVSIIITDSIGLITELNYTNVNFNFPPTEVSGTELAAVSITCNAVAAGSSTSCSFALPVFRVFPSLGINLYIGSSAVAGSCTEVTVGSGNVTCGSVPTSAADPAGATIIKVQIGSGTKKTSVSTVTLNP